MGCRPTVDFIGIGAPKAGTTWLARALEAHPEIGFSASKSTDFFSLDLRSERGNYMRFNGVNGDTGKSAVDEVIITSELSGGSVNYDFPDLLVRWKGDAPIRRLVSDEIGEVRETVVDKHTGAHTDKCLFVIRGPGIGAGRALPEGKLVDVGPTIVHLRGGSCPDGLDGRVMGDIMH